MSEPMSQERLNRAKDLLAMHPNPIPQSILDAVARVAALTGPCPANLWSSPQHPKHCGCAGTGRVPLIPELREVCPCIKWIASEKPSPAHCVPCHAFQRHVAECTYCPPLGLGWLPLLSEGQTAEEQRAAAERVGWKLVLWYVHFGPELNGQPLPVVDHYVSQDQPLESLLAAVEQAVKEQEVKVWIELGMALAPKEVTQ